LDQRPKEDLMNRSFRSVLRAVVLTACASVLVASTAHDADAAKKKKKAKAAPTAPVKAPANTPVEAAEPAKAVEPAKVVEPVKAAAVDVTDLWNAECKKCHGPDGKGKPSKTADMSDAAWQKGFTDAQIRKTIVEGFERDKDGATQKMKGFPKLTPAQLDGLVAHVRAFKK
jgi:mono/diheme cytochrome c family protein